MKILVLNCGSSSIKYKLFENEKPLTAGLIEKIGEKDSPIQNYAQGMERLVRQLLESGTLESLSEIDAVGHRVVHGGELSEPSLIDESVIEKIKNYCELAPLHNPVNLKGILEMQQKLPDVPHVAVFDTAFHQTMPAYAFLYGLPYEYYEKEGIRRYGFHGTSHAYVAEMAAKLLNKPLSELNLITCHLGAGCSMAAVKNGKVIDTSMGLTPLEGLIMGTRSGDIDAGVVIYFANKKQMTFSEIDEVLNKRSGLAGISGVGKDIRVIIKEYKRGSKRSRLAIEMFCYRLKKYIGSYAAALDKVDAIVFTAGIGEHRPLVRSLSTDIKILGIEIDENKNTQMVGRDGIISSDNSKIKVLVIGTDEEKKIAIETMRLVNY